MCQSTLTGKLCQIAFASIAVAACSSSGGGQPPARPPADDRDGGLESSITPIAAVGPCVETQTTPGRGDPSIAYKVWDAERRVLSLGSSAEAVAAGSIQLAWRYDETGKPLAYAGFSSTGGYGNFQQDYRYDVKGNVVDFYLSYPPQPNVMTPSGASPWLGNSYANEYDDAGRLVASTVTPYGPGWQSQTQPTRVVFQEDDQGRCTSTETPEPDRSGMPEAAPDVFVLTRHYDANGRLDRLEQRIAHDDGDFYPCAEFTTLFAFDDRGRMLSERTWCSESTDGPVSRSVTHTFDADGTEHIESLDFTTDTPNDMVAGPSGQVQYAGHSFLVRSPACAIIDAAIAPVTDLKCHTR